MPTSVSAVVILSDNFALNDTNREAGDLLNGVPVQSYNPTYYGTAPSWVATTNAVFTPDANITVNSQAGSYVRVATPNQTEGVLNLSADITFGVSNAADWIGLGFALDTTVSITNSSNTLLVILNQGGTVSLFKNGTTTTFYNRPWTAWNDTPFNLATTYNFELQYDRTNGLVDVFIDGVNIRHNVATPSVTVGALNSSTFGSVGVMMLATPSGTAAIDNYKLDNFLYTIPEPSSLALAGLAIGMFLLRRHRRNLP